MQTVTYGLKLALDHAVAFAKRVTGGFGLTPARFDVLHVLHASAEKTAPRQKWFCEKLGVSPGTIARALKQLEQAGLVHRARNPDDARSKMTTFTKEGLQAIRRALFELQMGTNAWVIEATKLSRPFMMAMLAVTGFIDSTSLVAPIDGSSLGYAAAETISVAAATAPETQAASSSAGGVVIDDGQQLLEAPRELLPTLGTDGHVTELPPG